MSDSQPLSVQSWSDVYQLLRAKAEASRGTITLTPSDAPRVTYPHTISRDAFALVLVFDTAVNEHASANVVTRWIWESDLLSGEPEDSTDPYVGNRSLWDTLPAVASELDRVQAPLPAQSVIDDAIRELETPRPTVADEIRNGATTMLVTVFIESTWKAMAQRQLQFFCRLRGEQVAGNPFVPSIPATGNADVLSLADYWTDQLARIGARATDTYHRMVYSCWREVLYRVQRHAKHAPAHETYVHNTEFWTALTRRIRS